MFYRAQDYALRHWHFCCWDVCNDFRGNLKPDTLTQFLYEATSGAEVLLWHATPSLDARVRRNLV